MKPFLIIKTGGTFGEFAESHGDFEEWTATRMGLSPEQWKCVNVRAGEPLPNPTAFTGCVITGSHDMVTDGHSWIKDTGAWIHKAEGTGLPILGICFGHQLMAHALGGEAGYLAGGPEIGTVSVALTPKAVDDPLFSALPATFPGHVTHSQSALSLPPGAVLLASSTREPHQAFRVGRSAWGVQFHPEFDAEATRHYVREQADKITAMGQNTKDVLAAVVETPEATGLLKAFVRYSLSGGGQN